MCTHTGSRYRLYMVSVDCKQLTFIALGSQLTQILPISSLDNLTDECTRYLRMFKSLVRQESFESEKLRSIFYYDDLSYMEMYLRFTVKVCANVRYHANKAFSR